MAVLTNGTWVLIADGEKALFLRNSLDASSPALDVVRKDEQENPSDYDQSANRPGRKRDTGVGQSSAMDDTDWHELAKERFAHELGDILYKYAHRGAFERIILVATPPVLGDLRQALHKEVQAKVVAEIPKDLTHHPLDKIETMLKTELDPKL
ncbi:Protein required for attachment to host cells [Roseovarius tolerans]|uniref:Protein required for attachment to host cells n=1 Tax=Roseovarius tolerans TaxID=74031 RepID=A0A1H7UVT0_9RHOB|nr:host attachment family protein [Roseovarius tolerans]SEM00577.1 Protein required for attachment to host cells [Roseovarius tolerans]